MNTKVNRKISRQELFEFARQVDQSRKKTPDYPFIDIICQEIHTFFNDVDPSKHQLFLNQVTIFHKNDQTTLFPYLKRSLPTPDFFVIKALRQRPMPYSSLTNLKEPLIIPYGLKITLTKTFFFQPP